MKGVVLAGTSSGTGKTVATLVAMHALERAGYTVQPSKAGPDFIDPSHHRVVADRPSRTLDVWLQGQDGTRRNYHRGNGDICLVEGVMGLYDGDGSSTAMVAEALDLPVVLVVDASAGMESVGATALGFAAYADRIGRDIDVAGVLAQRAHGGRHENGIREALPEELTYFGRIPPDDRLEIPDRHLGLEMGTEAALDDAVLEEAAATVKAERLVEAAETPPAPSTEAVGMTSEDETVSIAMAEDEAFCFFYPGTVERLRACGDLTTFSPLAGDEVPPADAIYLPGGYPELHASQLASSATLDGVAARASEGVPLLAECGGFMALTDSLTTGEGTTAEMGGLFPATVEMHDRYQALDHVSLVGTGNTTLAPKDTERRGHEFHYSSATLQRDAQFAFEVERGDGIDGAHDGLVEHRAVGTYTHCHAESGLFDALVEAALESPV